LISSIKTSNDSHRDWAQRKLAARFGSLKGVRVAVLGLTYKPDTDTLRRSTSVELCQWLLLQGAEVAAHDPRVRALPAELSGAVQLASSPGAAMAGAQAVVIATPWPEYKTLSAEAVRDAMAVPVVIDANRVASANLSGAGVEYISVGTPAKRYT